MSALVEFSSRTLIDELIEEQRRMTAAERFAGKHERHELPMQAKFYRDLIPLNAPQAGEQYAFAVDLDACTGCKACVSACHSLNGLDEDESWRSVGLLRGGGGKPWQQTVTTACHHCADPACANGCPTLAYEKDDTTGIVRHLDDQCIGCQYCTLKCPYDVPKYSERLGIVRKCDMCQGRLAAGEAPACVQACPNGAIRIEVVGTGGTAGGAIVPGAFDSAYTKPTTAFRTARRMPLDAAPADAGTLRLEHAHWPLVIMLVLTQMAAGLHIANAIVRSPSLALAAFVILGAGLAASVAHLGRPLKAWRAFLGWRKSWMSREIIVFGGYGAVAAALAVLPESDALPAAAAGTAIAAVFCSAMIYVDTRRPAWVASITFPRFFGTALLLGATSGGALFAWMQHPLAATFAIVATAIRTALFTWDRWNLGMALRDEKSPNHVVALTIVDLLPRVLTARTVLFVTSTAFSIAAVVTAAPLWAALALASTTAGVVLERYSFFAASSAPRMPGL
jgi:formate dehydrogenase iron-sulfur subunit